MDFVDDASLDRYADLALQVGLGLLPDQPLLIRTSIEGAPLARRVARRAYQQGSGKVSVLYADSEVTRAELRHARDEVLRDYPAWKALAINDTMPSGTAVLSITAADPDVFADEEPHRVSMQQNAARSHLKPFYEGIGGHGTNWCIVGMPVPAWAEKVFPDESSDEALRKLWGSVLASVRVDHDDPVAAWTRHIDELEALAASLDDHRFEALHFRGPGTDLRLGLADEHVWNGASSKAATGATFVANLPTEEIFTAPHRDRVDGIVRATKPLSYAGKIIDGFSLRFEGGKVVEARAERGEDILHELLDTDEGARRLGEVALVSASGPIAKRNHLFFDTLYDENAASHVALGRAYRFTVRNGASMTVEEVAKHGANDSLTHVDFMIGSPELDVDGVRGAGDTVPVMRAGEFVL
jgi:aminopeptidase